MPKVKILECCTTRRAMKTDKKKLDVYFDMMGKVGEKKMRAR